MPDRSIILTGFMGSGKSSVGIKLAKRLSLPFIDLDAAIVRQAGKSIKQIFAEEGEAAFRDMEAICLEQTLVKAAVIATGGGAVLADRNRQLMQNRGLVVNLMVSLPEVLKRLDGSEDRPLYSQQNPVEHVRRLMEQREEFYAQADIRIDTDGKSVEDVAEEIVSILTELDQ